MAIVSLHPRTIHSVVCTGLYPLAIPRYFRKHLACESTRGGSRSGPGSRAWHWNAEKAALQALIYKQITIRTTSCTAGLIHQTARA